MAIKAVKKAGTKKMGFPKMPSPSKTTATLRQKLTHNRPAF